VARAGLAVVASLVLWSILPAVLGWAPRVILSGSMEPRIHVGDVIVTREVPAAALTKGQVITVKDPDHPAKTRTHRLLRRESDGTLVTKGDANPQADSSHVTVNDVLGVGVIRVPFVGRPAYWLAERNWAALGVTAVLLGWFVVSAFPGRKQDDAPEKDDTSGPGNSRGGSRRSRRVAAVVAVSVISVGVMGAPADAAAFKKTTTNLSNVLNAAANFYPYRTAVLADSPYLYWRLSETSGTVVADAGAGAKDGTLLAQTYAQGQTGALASETRDKSLGLTIGTINANASVAGPTTFSVEAWIKSTSTTGGRILGFGNATGQTASTTTDRQLYLAPNGKVMFGVGATKVAIASTAAVNNGAWHHVVGTYTSGPNGMKLYVDGVLQSSSGTATPVTMTGYWRAGAEDLTGWPSAPTDGYFEGGLDELAVYPTALSAARVLAHYNAGITP
jgi:signal peptidase I